MRPPRESGPSAPKDVAYQTAAPKVAIASSSNKEKTATMDAGRWGFAVGTSGFSPGAFEELTSSNLLDRGSAPQVGSPTLGRSRKLRDSTLTAPKMTPCDENLRPFGRIDPVHPLFTYR
ncbi:hypothetical protein GCM10009596_27630 [Arthrobacter rhombi]